MLLSAAWGGVLYVAGFVRDRSDVPARLALAADLQRAVAGGDRRVAIIAEPAPYCLPPVDLFQTELWKLAQTEPNRAGSDLLAESGDDLLVRAVDVPRDGGLGDGLTSTRISWADKPFEIERRDGAPFSDDRR